MALAPVVLALAVYTTGLDVSPPYLMHDELQFSLQARSIAETGRDLSGRRFPIYFTEPEFPAGRDPVIIYATAAALTVTPFSERGVKLPTAFVGVLNVALMVVAGRVLLGNYWMGALAAVLLALTPIHFIRARLVLSPLYSVPFVLGWLIALAGYLRSGSRRSLLAAAALITASVYTYLACTVMAPIYLAMTLALAIRREGRSVIAPIIGVAAIVLAPLVIWSLTHPERYRQLIEAYQLYGSASSSPLVPQHTVPDAPGIPRLWISLVWQVFNPDFLFISGDSSLVNSTRQAGLFPMAFAVLIPFGLWAAHRSTEALYRVVAIGFITAPVASILSSSIQMNRLMLLIPFGVLLAGTGAAHLLRAGVAARVLAAILLASVPLQFASFHRHYMSDYREQAAPWFGSNVRDMVRILAGGRGNAYVSSRVPFADRYWSFYAPDGRRHAMQLTGETVPDGSAGDRAGCRVADGMCDTLARDGRWKLLASVEDPSGAGFRVFERR